jgi:hypothetical protein
MQKYAFTLAVKMFVDSMLFAALKMESELGVGIRAEALHISGDPLLPDRPADMSFCCCKASSIFFNVFFFPRHLSILRVLSFSPILAITESNNTAKSFFHASSFVCLSTTNLRSSCASESVSYGHDQGIFYGI